MGYISIVAVAICAVAAPVFTAGQTPPTPEERGRLLRESTKNLLKELEETRNFISTGLSPSERATVQSIVFRIPDEDTDDTVECWAGIDPIDGKKVIWVGLGFARSVEMYIDAYLLSNAIKHRSEFNDYVELIRVRWRENIERRQKGLPELRIASPYEYFRAPQLVQDSIAQQSAIIWGGALSFVVAHEAGHIVKNHAVTRTRPIENERQADEWAVQTLLAAGQPPVAGVVVMEFFNTFFAHDPAHPAPEERMRAMVATTLANLDQYRDRFQSRGMSIESVRAQLNQALDLLGNSAPSSAPSIDFPTALEQIVAAANNQFQTVRGERDPDGDGEAWRSTVTVPGSRECTVWILRDRSPDISPYVTCIMSRGSDSESLRREYDVLVSRVAESLGSGWTRQMGSGSTHKYESRFRRNDSGCELSVFVTKSDGTKARLEIEFDSQ